jgi:hypothetical protein
MTAIIGRRIAPELIIINGEPCTKTIARKAATCVTSRKPIKPGDLVYRPLGNSSTRSARYLASEIEAIETQGANP